ncbi:MAG TPA: hypothetical protein VK983_01730, partial [Candidatus Limnocylindrales bacterium]|nr:hypothetical protein [Candidatus Limnocylindrales bacterium]
MHEEDSRLFWSDTDPQAESTLEELVGGLSPLELHRQDLVTYYAAARVAGRKFLEIEQGIAEQATKIESIANILDDKSVYHNPSFIRELRNLQKTAEEKRLML